MRQNLNRIQSTMGPHEQPCRIPVPHVTQWLPECLKLKTLILIKVIHLIKKTSACLAENKQAHFQSCLGHFLSIVIISAQTHLREGKKKLALKGKSAQNGANTSAIMAL